MFPSTPRPNPKSWNSHHLGEYDLGGYSLGAWIVARPLTLGAKPQRAFIGGTGPDPIVHATGRGENYRRILSNLGTWEPGHARSALRELRKTGRCGPGHADPRSRHAHRHRRGGPRSRGGVHARGERQGSPGARTKTRFLRGYRNGSAWLVVRSRQRHRRRHWSDALRR
jgi:hypothetical protein